MYCGSISALRFLVRLPGQVSTDFRITVKVAFPYSAWIIAGASLSVPDQKSCQFRCYGYGKDKGSYQKSFNTIQLFSSKLFGFCMDVWGSLRVGGLAKRVSKANTIIIQKRFF